MDQALLIIAAAFCGGMLNAAAGGGSFLTLPALIVAGLPPVAANATGTLALLPGYVSSAIGFREDFRMPAGLSLAALVAGSLTGGALGAVLLLITPNDTFRMLIPWLLVAATIAFALAPRLVDSAPKPETGKPAALAGLMAVAVYGGYFNGGLGIVLLALFSLLGVSQIHAANGLKNLVSALLTVIAVIVYAWGGAIYWTEALIMMVAATVGGYVGARWSRRVPTKYVRYFVIVVGAVMAALFFVA